METNIQSKWKMKEHTVAIIVGLMLGLWSVVVLMLWSNGLVFSTWMYLLVVTNVTTALFFTLAYRSHEQ